MLIIAHFQIIDGLVTGLHRSYTKYFYARSFFCVILYFYFYTTGNTAERPAARIRLRSCRQFQQIVDIQHRATFRLAKAVLSQTGP